MAAKATKTADTGRMGRTRGVINLGKPLSTKVPGTSPVNAFRHKGSVGFLPWAHTERAICNIFAIMFHPSFRRYSLQRARQTMTTARDIVSSRVVVAMAAERLADVAAKMRVLGALHCVVSGRPGRFLGVVRVADMIECTNPGGRILADLVAAARPISVRPDEPAWAVAELIERNRVYEVVVEHSSGEYAGLITAESVLDWLVSEHRSAKAEQSNSAHRSAELKKVSPFSRQAAQPT